MALQLEPTESAIARGIKTVGVGKKGSHALSPDLVQEIINDLRSNRIPEAAKGAFFAGLLAKGIEPQEQPLIDYIGNIQDLPSWIETLTHGAPAFAKWVCVHLIQGHHLDQSAAHDVGNFMFSKEQGDCARGFIASFLRVRYESNDEYFGLWRAMQETIEPPFLTPTPKGAPIVQLAEPFNGTDHSYMITPVIGHYLQTQHFRSVYMVGRNSGPKFILNLDDIAQELKASYLKAKADLGNNNSPWGWFIHQSDVSKSLDRWVNLRRETIKRPFLATLEKFIRPLDADYIITSAFHPPYGEKMLCIAEHAGFKGICVVRNGMEGSIAFPLKRPVKILLSSQMADGCYQRHELEFDAQEFLGEVPPVEEQRENLTPQENARFIQNYISNGTSGDMWFDLRAKATIEGIKRAMAWLQSKENV